MIETPRPVHTHGMSSLYIYKRFQHLEQWLPVIRMQPHPDICPLGLESGCCFGIGGGSLFVLMIETPHTLHTHSRSSLYIYNAIQHLQQWLPVIRMQPHPDICSLRPVSGCGFPRCRRKSHCGLYDWQPSHTSYSWQVFFIHIKSVSAPNIVAKGHKEATPNVSPTVTTNMDNGGGWHYILMTLNHRLP